MAKKKKIKVVQKQKQKVSQKTSVVVNIGDKNKVSRKKKSSAPPARPASNVSVSLQGGGYTPVYQPPTNEYNAILSQLQLLQRQQAKSGQLQSRDSVNDIYTQVNAVSPFQINNVMQSEMTNPYKNPIETFVDDATNMQYNQHDNSVATVPIDRNPIPAYRKEAFLMTGEDIRSKQMNDFFTEQENEDAERLAMRAEEDISAFNNFYFEDERKNRNLGERLSNQIAPSFGNVVQTIAQYDDNDLDDILADEVLATEVYSTPVAVARAVEGYGGVEAVPYLEADVLGTDTPKNIRQLRAYAQSVLDDSIPDKSAQQRYVKQWREDNNIPINKETAFSKMGIDMLKAFVADLPNISNVKKGKG